MNADDNLRDALQKELYDSLCWFGTLPEPQGDVPERYHKWDDLGEVADRLIKVIKDWTAEEPKPVDPLASRNWRL